MISKGVLRHTGWRIAGLLLLLELGLVAAGAPLALAHAEHAGLALLDQLGPSLSDSPSTIVVNGQRLFVASRVSELEVGAVLDAVEQGCRAPAASPEPGAW